MSINTASYPGTNGAYMGGIGGQMGGQVVGQGNHGDQAGLDARMMEEIFGTQRSVGQVGRSGLRLSDLGAPPYDSYGTMQAGPSISSRPYQNQIQIQAQDHIQNQHQHQVGALDLANMYGAYTFSDLFTPIATPTSAATITNQIPPLPASSQQVILPLQGPGTVALNAPQTLVPASSAAISINNSALASRRGTNTMPAMMQFPLTIPAVIEEPIEHTFPSADSKRLFQHVRAKTSTVIVALGMGLHEAKNPFMAMVTRLMRVDPTSAAQTAFRHSLLSLGAAHVCYQHHLTSPEQCQQMRVRTVKSKRKATLHLFMPTQKQEEGYTDLLLATCLTLYLRNVGPKPDVHPLDLADGTETVGRRFMETESGHCSSPYYKMRRTWSITFIFGTALRSSFPTRATGCRGAIQ